MKNSTSSSARPVVSLKCTNDVLMLGQRRRRRANKNVDKTSAGPVLSKFYVIITCEGKSKINVFQIQIRININRE